MIVLVKMMLLKLAVVERLSNARIVVMTRVITVGGGERTEYTIMIFRCFCTNYNPKAPNP